MDVTKVLGLPQGFSKPPAALWLATVPVGALQGQPWKALGGIESSSPDLEMSG